MAAWTRRASCSCQCPTQVARTRAENSIMSWRIARFIPAPYCLRFDAQVATFVLCRAFCNVGSRIVSSSAMITTTTSVSISVKAFRVFMNCPSGSRRPVTVARNTRGNVRPHHYNNIVTRPAVLQTPCLRANGQNSVPRVPGTRGSIGRFETGCEEDRPDACFTAVGHATYIRCQSNPTRT